MAEMKYVKELLSTGLGTPAQLLIPQTIHSVLLDEVEKALIPRSEAALFLGPAQVPGSSVYVDLEAENSMDVRAVAEGAEVPLDQASYTSIQFLPVKYGVAIRITAEMMEDSQFPLLELNLRTAGRRFAENENSLVVTDALDNAANTTAGGANITIANITAAMQNLNDSDYTATTFFVGMEVLNDLRNIDTFVEANKLGSREMLESGFVGRIYGMNVISVSTNAGMTTTSSYIIDNRHAYGIAEKRPLSVERFELPTFDMSGAVLTQRLKVAALRTNAIAKITTS